MGCSTITASEWPPQARRGGQMRTSTVSYTHVSNLAEVSTVTEPPFPSITGSVNTNVPHFRSPNEALRHFYWLASGRLDRPSCKCKHCGPEQRQRKLNADLVEEVGEQNLAPSSRCPSVIDPLDQARRSIALQSTPRSLPSAPRGNVPVGSSELRRQRSEQTRGPSLWEVVEQTATH